MADSVDYTVSRWRREGQAGFRDYIVHVALSDIEPPIWRRIRLADSIPLPLLHRVLQVAFGWENRHVHQFQVGTVNFGEPDEESDLIDERRVRLNQLLHKPGDRLRYEYDLGDSWEHDVLLEDMRASDEPVASVQCLAGERAGPPEDAGGSAGYSELKAALADPRHPEHADLAQWAGNYDPTAFDLQDINRQLSRLTKVRRPIKMH